MTIIVWGARTLGDHVMYFRKSTVANVIIGPLASCTISGAAQAQNLFVNTGLENSNSLYVTPTTQNSEQGEMVL